MEQKHTAGGTTTKELILTSARKYFLRLGFQATSIRKIASDAGFTPGALYGYFGSKEKLFYALTDPLIGRILAKLDGIEKEMMAIPAEKRLLKMNSIFNAAIPELVDIIFEDREIVDLVINGAKGTKYENFLGELAKRDTRAISEAAENAADEYPNMFDAQTLPILTEGYIATLFHLIVSGRDKENVIHSMKFFGNIYEAGMLALMKKREDLTS